MNEHSFGISINHCDPFYSEVVPFSSHLCGLAHFNIDSKASAISPTGCSLNHVTSINAVVSATRFDKSSALARDVCCCLAFHLMPPPFCRTRVPTNASVNLWKRGRTMITASLMFGVRIMNSRRVVLEEKRRGIEL